MGFLGEFRVGDGSAGFTPASPKRGIFDVLSIARIDGQQDIARRDRPLPTEA
jgi:hypothetical protein